MIQAVISASTQNRFIGIAQPKLFCHTYLNLMQPFDPASDPLSPPPFVSFPSAAVIPKDWTPTFFRLLADCGRTNGEMVPGLPQSPSSTYSRTAVPSHYVVSAPNPVCFLWPPYHPRGLRYGLTPDYSAALSLGVRGPPRIYPPIYG